MCFRRLDTQPTSALAAEFSFLLQDVMAAVWTLHHGTSVTPAMAHKLGVVCWNISLWLWWFHFLFCGKRATYFNVRQKMTNLRKVTCLEFLV